MTDLDVVKDTLVEATAQLHTTGEMLDSVDQKLRLMAEEHGVYSLGAEQISSYLLGMDKFRTRSKVLLEQLERDVIFNSASLIQARKTLQGRVDKVTETIDYWSQQLRAVAS